MKTICDCSQIGKLVSRRKDCFSLIMKVLVLIFASSCGTGKLKNSAKIIENQETVIRKPERLLPPPLPPLMRETVWLDAQVSPVRKDVIKKICLQDCSSAYSILSLWSTTTGEAKYLHLRSPPDLCPHILDSFYDIDGKEIFVERSGPNTFAKLVNGLKKSSERWCGPESELR